ncbi:DnaJ domain-containing protein [Scleroderma yunnanense]
MRLILVFTFLAALLTAVSAWTKEDHEIFDLVSELEASEGKGTTFYSWLGVSSTASLTEINKAYRKKSIQIHPDKNPGVKGIHERFARLGVIVNTLRSADGRARYDFFYKNGVPRWRGTGYYYSRFRPGLGAVLMFLTMLTTGLQYLVQRTNYQRDLNRVRRTIGDARLAAWGPKMAQLEGRRKVKVNLGGGPRSDEDGRIVPGKMIDMVVEGNDVYILDPLGELHLLNEDIATPPALGRTWLIALVRAAFCSLFRKDGKGSPSGTDGERQESDDEQSDASGGGSVSPGGASENQVPWKGTRAAAVKTGGRRRKMVRK